MISFTHRERKLRLKEPKREMMIPAAVTRMRKRRTLRSFTSVSVSSLTISMPAPKSFFSVSSLRL